MKDRSRAGCLFVFIGLLIICMAVTPAQGLQISVKTDTEWLVAGDTGGAVVTATVNGSDGHPLKGVNVAFSCDTTMGSLSRMVVETDKNGLAVTTFLPGEKSGIAQINVTARYGVDTGASTFEQEIDHASPYRLHSLECENEVTAGSTTGIVLSMEDEYGNLIDARNINEVEAVAFYVGSPGDGAYFENGKKEIVVPVSEGGEVRVSLTTATTAGENIVYIDFPGAIDSRYLTITGLANGEPSTIYQMVSPKAESLDEDDYPEQPLDRSFSITYALYDQHGNAAGDRQIKINVRSVSGSLTAGEWIVTTNSQGKAMITYGPSERAGVVDIVATAVDNSSVTRAQRVGFYSTTPTNMILTAVPQTIASRDVKKDLVSHVKAKVTDTRGNPVRNESVSFRLIGVDNGIYLVTDDPEISNNTRTSEIKGVSLLATTDKDGLATIDFYPGAFTVDPENSRYSSMASGNATIQAVWGDQKENITISFRNYPYLSVSTSVEPRTVTVNGTVNVTVQLTGDGWALQSRPIDVVLCTDRSGSMLKNTTTISGYNQYDQEWIKQESIDDRMVHAMAAAKVFVSKMKSAKDRIGLVSFGQNGTTNLDGYYYKYWAGRDYIYEIYYVPVWDIKKNDWKLIELYSEWEPDESDDNDYISKHYNNSQTYSGPATRDLELISTYRTVNTEIDNWLPCGGTPMREGLYQSVQMIIDRPRPSDNPVKAIVLLTDGEWNTGGNPEGGDEAKSLGDLGNRNVIQYANESDIKIFTIALGDEPSHEELRRYAEDTGGKFYSATAGDDLTRVYEDIAQKLQEAAGVNTTMDLYFDRVMINTTPTSDVFEYQYQDPVSTREEKYWTHNNSVFWGPESYDQSSDWEDNTLSFNIEDIYLNQTWETTFCLKVLKEGNIDIFGNESRIHFNGTLGETELGLPHTFITAVQVLKETNVTTADIQVDSLNTSVDSGILDLSWHLTYTGNEDVIQEVTYQISPDNVWWDGTWQVADMISLSSGVEMNGTYSSSLDQRGKQGWYKIRISALEDIPGGVCDEVTYNGIIQVGKDERAYIRLE
ncbi:VWA domain-containing protein [Methanofollis aquaemaris]|uniref:VWA domain-containing protein n=1 Tax=Methanofollis aquaemaris TaxID=126734 RepID=A0A8A3S4W0_9EURY|nr:VWA domain-containing protein [Methanofollis aquaemaris]QSZ67155.1 VWA domain-containing protein [Methanofollis aquaemaris]